MIAQIHPRSSFLPLTNIVCRQRFSCTGISFRMNFKRTKSMILTYDIHKVCPTFQKSLWWWNHSIRLILETLANAIDHVQIRLFWKIREFWVFVFFIWMLLSCYILFNSCAVKYFIVCFCRLRVNFPRRPFINSFLSGYFQRSRDLTSVVLVARIQNVGLLFGSHGEIQRLLTWFWKNCWSRL